MNEAQEACARAADYIAEHGWTQGMYTDGEKVCMLGALSRVTPEGRILFVDADDGADCYSSVRKDAVYHLSRYLVAQGLLRTFGTGHPIGSPAFYNDRPDVTQEDAVLALKRAAHWDGEK